MDQIFHCVYAFDDIEEVFEVIGVFSKLEDAQALEASTIQEGRKNVVVTKNPVKAIKAQLLEERLGKLHDVLLKLEAQALKFEAASTVHGSLLTVRPIGLRG